MGPDYKGFNATGVLGAAGIRTFVATSPDTARGALADAAAAALQGGAAALLLPVNVQLADMDLAKAARPGSAETDRGRRRRRGRRRSKRPSPWCGRAASP